MKKTLLVLAAGLLTAVSAWAVEDEVEPLGGRISAKADWKIAKGLHVTVEEELRLNGDYLLDRSYTSAGISYKITDWLKAGVEYTAIGVHKELEVGYEVYNYVDWRHRVSADLTGTVKIGRLKLSLRERVQGTHKTAEKNNFQQPQTEWVLRSRLKAAYKFRNVPLEPYVFLEPRLLFNGAKWSEEGVTEDFKSATFLGHKDVYFSRIRSAAGVEWKLNSRNSFDFYVLYDYLTDKEIDARKEGSNKGIQLKEPIYTFHTHKLSICVGYKFSF